MEASSGVQTTTTTTTTSSQTMWQDITDELKQSVCHLNLGELLHSDHFTLFEAMSAIELMDPRMDSGVALKKCNRKILNFDQSVKAGLLKINDFEPSELLGIIDETYSALVSWLEGNFLAQTVMTNLYLHGPEKIEDRCLRVFSLAALKLTKYIDTMVGEVLCVEEEDFQLNRCNFNLDLQVTDQKVLNYLEDLCQSYEKMSDINHNSNKVQNNHKTTNNNNGTNNNNVTNQLVNNKTKQDKQPINSNQESSSLYPEKLNEKIDSIHLSALINRLRFTYHFYACFFHFHRNVMKDTQSMTEFDKQTDAQISKAIKLIQSATLVCDQHLEKCLTYLNKWTETIDLGVKPTAEHSPNDTTTCDVNYPTILGFDPLLNNKLPPVSFRSPPRIDRPTTVSYLESFINRMRQCIAISGTFYQRSLIKSLNSIENFSKYYKEGSCVISRSLLQALYLPVMSVKMFRDEIIQSMLEYCEPLGQLMRANEEDQKSQNGNQNVFLDSAQKSFAQIVTLYGHNPSRQHERYPDLITSFKSLQYQCAYESSMAYSWSTYHLARICIKYVLSSFELELFSAHEYPYVFWYLYEILYKNEREQLELARQFMENQELVEEAKKRAKGKKNRRTKSKTAFHEGELLRNDAYRFLTGGTFLLTHGLKLQNKIKTPLMDFTNEEICFDHRFGPLTGTSVYESYKLTLSKLNKLDHIYREALDCFSEAKEIFTLMGEHENCLKVCKANMVVTRILSTNQESFKDREVDFSFKTHPSFPTVKFL